MEIDLAELREMHPQLPEDLVLMMTVRAALGLQRNGHVSPVEASLEVEQVAMRGLLAWPGSDLTHLEQHDSNRVTEDGAEAVVLALATEPAAGASCDGCSEEIMRIGCSKSWARDRGRWSPWR